MKPLKPIPEFASEAEERDIETSRDKIKEILQELDIREDVDTDTKAGIAYGALQVRVKRIKDRYGIE